MEYALWLDAADKANELLSTFDKAVKDYNVAHAPARKAAGTRAVQALNKQQHIALTPALALALAPVLAPVLALA